MHDQPFAPTPHAEVNAALAALLQELRNVLGARLIGLYLHGSLAGGDFDPATSDIDFLAAIDAPLPGDLVAALEQLHLRLAGSFKWAAKLEGSYVPLADLRRCNPAGGPYASINEGRFELEQDGGGGVIARHILREQGLALAGPPPASLIDPVAPEALRQAVLDNLRYWWAPMLDDPSWLHRADYQAFAVLTMCRALYTLERGDLASKPSSARWAIEAYPRWAALIERALDWRPPLPFDQLEETLALMRFTVA